MASGSTLTVLFALMAFAFNVFVSSSCYELRDMRARLQEWLSGMGFNPILSEGEGFPHTDGMPPYASCLRTMDECAMVICLGRCCFICGAQPGSKVFNDEHVIPEWVLRKFNLFNRTITLPNGGAVIVHKPICAEKQNLIAMIQERTV